MQSRFFVKPLIVGGLIAATGVVGSYAYAQSVQENQRVTSKLKSVVALRVTNPAGGKVVSQITPTNRAGQGEFSRVVIKSSPARIKDIFLTEFSLDASNTKIDVPYLFKRRRIKTVRAATKLRAVMSEGDVTRMFAEGNSTRDMKLKVKFLTNNRIQISGNLNYTLINGPVVGIGRLSQAPGSKVNLNIISLKLRGVEVPGFVKDRFSQSLNPIIEYSDLPFSPKFKTFYIKGNKAYLST